MALEDRLVAVLAAEFTSLDCSRLGSGVRGQIETARARGRSAFPTLFVDDEAFARHLARALKRMPDAISIADLAAEDLYLACACLVGARGAANILLDRYRDVARRVIARLAGELNAEEIVQGLISDLLVGTSGSPPQIGDYAGRAPLARWLDVAAQRAALRWLRTERTRASVAGRAVAEPRLQVDTPPDTSLFREQHQVAFEQALKQALRRAPEKDRALLRLHLVDGIRMERIGTMLGVSQPTASRRLKRAREAVLGELKIVLRRTLKISSEEIGALGSLVSSRLDLSIAELLKGSDG